MVDGAAVASTTNTLTYTFTTAGIHQVKVIATNTVGSDADSMDVDVYVCETVTQFPFMQGFENGLRCWGMVSLDPANDGNFGLLNSASYAYEGDFSFLFSSYNSAADYNQYLITPELQIPTDASYMIDFFYMGYSADDNFKVLYSTTTDDISSFTELADYQNVEMDWTEASVLLPAGTKYVAINYYGNYAYYLFVDNISIRQLTAPTVTLNGPTSIETGTMAEFTAVSPLAETFAWTIDGNTVSNTTEILNYTFTTSGNHTVSVTATNSIGSATASLNVYAITCGEAQNLPYFEGFDTEAPACWTILDEDADGYSWMNAGYQPYEGSGCISSASYVNNVGPLNPDNWLISPALNIPANGAKLSFFVNAQDAGYYEEHYGVYVSTTGTNPNNFTLLYEEDLDAGDRAQTPWAEKTVNLDYSNQTIYIAIRHFNCTDMFWINLDNFSVTPGVGIENHDVKTVIFPNPANDVLNINSTANINRVEVYNMMGQLVGAYNANDVNTQINTSRFANGVYTVKVETENGTTTQKFTVAR
jgi:PKD repeat protein